MTSSLHLSRVHLITLLKTYVSFFSFAFFFLHFSSAAQKHLSLCKDDICRVCRTKKRPVYFHDAIDGCDINTGVGPWGLWKLPLTCNSKKCCQSAACMCVLLTCLICKPMNTWCTKIKNCSTEHFSLAFFPTGLKVHKTPSTCRQMMTSLYRILMFDFYKPFFPRYGLGTK